MAALVIRLFDVEVLSVTLATGYDDEPAQQEYGPPFGFSASAGGVAELSEPWSDVEVTNGRRR